MIRLFALRETALWAALFLAGHLALPSVGWAAPDAPGSSPADSSQVILDRIGALEADMEHTRKELVEVQGLAAQKQEEVLERDRQIDGLESHRQELEQSLDQVNITLGEKQGSLDLVRGELTGQRLINEALQARLRDRWENLLRAFGLK